MRPRYETSEDRSHEESFANMLHERAGITAWKLPVSYAVDFFALSTEDRPIWIEFKRRHHQFGKYPDVILSALKWWNATSLTSRTGGTLVFAVEFDDQTRVCHWDPDNPWKPRISHGGRTRDTRDTADVEPVAHIDLVRFVSMRS
jgi:hypothetical protein